MVPSFLLLLLLSIGGTVLGQNDGGETADIGIPEKFFGAFQLDHSDNWDQYLAAKGYNDPEVRKKVELPRFTRILYQRSPGSYRMMIGTGLQGSKWLKGSKKHADWTFQLSKEFTGKYWDGKQHLITFTYDPTTERLTERHVKMGTQEPEEFVYAIDNENNMELHVNFKGVELVHHYKRTD